MPIVRRLLGVWVSLRVQGTEGGSETKTSTNTVLTPAGATSKTEGCILQTWSPWENLSFPFKQFEKQLTEACGQYEELLRQCVEGLLRFEKFAQGYQEGPHSGQPP